MTLNLFPTVQKRVLFPTEDENCTVVGRYTRGTDKTEVCESVREVSAGKIKHFNLLA